MPISVLSSQHLCPSMVSTLALASGPASANHLAQTRSWKAAHIAERMPSAVQITPLDIPDADAPPEITFHPDSESQQESNGSPHREVLDKVPQTVSAFPQRDGHREDGQRSHATEPRGSYYLENAAAAATDAASTQAMTEVHVDAVYAVDSVDAVRAALSKQTGVSPTADSDSLENLGFAFDLLTVASPPPRRYTAEFGRAATVKNPWHANQSRQQSVASESRYLSRRASCNEPRGTFLPPKSPTPPIPTRHWRSSSGGAGAGGGAGAVACNRSPTADTVSDYSEFGWDGSNADAAGTSPNHAQGFSSSRTRGSLKCFPNSASLSSIGQNRSKVCIQRSRTQALFGEIPGAVFEDPRVGAPIPEIRESDTGFGGSIFSNTAKNEDGATRCYTPCTSPLGNKTMFIVNQRHHKRHSIGEIDGTLFEELSKEDDATKVQPSPASGEYQLKNAFWGECDVQTRVSPKASQIQPQMVQEMRQLVHQEEQQQQQQQQRDEDLEQPGQQQDARRFRRSLSAQCNQISSPPLPADMDLSHAATNRWASGAPSPSPRVGSRSMRRKSGSSMVRPSLSSSSVTGSPGGTGEATSLGAGSLKTPDTPRAALGPAFCPSPRWVGKRSPVAFQRDLWGQQRGSQQEGRQQGGRQKGERQHARRHSVSEIDGSVFEELACAAQQLQE